MHRWTRFYGVAVAFTLATLCLFTFSTNSAPDSSHPSERGSYLASRLSDWSWMGSKKGDILQIPYQSNEDKDREADADRWNDRATKTARPAISRSDAPVPKGSSADTDDEPIWLDEVKNAKANKGKVSGSTPLKPDFLDTSNGYIAKSSSDEELAWLEELQTLPKGAKVSIAIQMPQQTDAPNYKAWIVGGNAAKTETKTVTATTTIREIAGDTDAGKSAKLLPPIQDLATSFDVDLKQLNDSPAGPKPNEIVMLTASDGGGHNKEIANITALVEENRRAYAAHHGYSYHSINTSQFTLAPSIHPVWKKIPAIISTFAAYPEAQWLWFLDLDAIIMTPSQDLNSLLLSHGAMLQALALGADFLDSSGSKTGHVMAKHPNLNGLDLLIGQDHAGLNAGSFFLRRSEWTRGLLDYLSDPVFMGLGWEREEQDVLMHFFKHHVTFRQHVGLLKMRTANAYPITGIYGWQKGDLAVHFAGCWVDNTCQEKWCDYWARREVLTD